jgi:hypothetical protein
MDLGDWGLGWCLKHADAHPDGRICIISSFDTKATRWCAVLETKTAGPAAAVPALLRGCRAVQG